jgi:hypothetical protein
VPQNNLPCRELKNILQSRSLTIQKFIMMKDQNNNSRNRGGRKPKMNPSRHRHVFRLNDDENDRLMSLFEESGWSNKAKFIVSVLFSKEIRTVTIDKGANDFYMRLTSLYSQFRSVGVNYNQVVKLLHTQFSDRKAAAFLYQLEKQTIELSLFCKKIIQITEEFERKHLKKED